MAHAHEGWIVDAFDGLSATEVKALHKLLGQVKHHYKQAQEEVS